MDSSTGLADEAADHLGGDRDGEILLTIMRMTCGDGDEIFRAIERASSNRARLRGLCRRLQKALEQAR